jgi:4-amino-4-deoxy-L-arabinose transferase-like glycosyltransferase
MAAVTATTADIPGSEVKHLRLLQAIIVFFVGVRVLYLLFAGPSPDEAYYWLWGQHPGLSYYDHPPFHAWLLGISDAIFGRSLFGLRWMTLATLAGTAYIFHIWARRYAGEQWQQWFWPGLVIYLASPTFGVFSSLAFHDYLLIFLILTSAHFFLMYFTDVVEKGRGRLIDLYLAAIILGCAGLTKYNAVFLGLAVFCLVVTWRPLRSQLRNPHLYLAAVVAVGMQAPVLIWNWQEGFASFRFHLVDRHTEGWLNAINWGTIGEFFAGAIFMMSPFLVPAFVRFFLSKPDVPFERVGKNLAVWAFWLSSLTFLFVSLTDSSWWWWNLVAYVVPMPFLAKYFGRGFLFYGHVVYGALVALHLLVSSTVFPWLIAVGGEDNFRRSLFGWEQMQAPMEAARAKYQPDFVASEGPEVGAIVAFALDDPDVRVLTPRPNQMLYWWNRDEHKGEDALVLIDDTRDVASIASQFETMTEVEVVPVVRFGATLNHWKIYYAENYTPNGEWTY